MIQLDGNSHLAAFGRYKTGISATVFLLVSVAAVLGVLQASQNEEGSAALKAMSAVSMHQGPAMFMSSMDPKMFMSDDKDKAVA